MGNVTSTIYSTTAKEPMTQLNFSTDFNGESAVIKVDFLKSGSVVTSQSYNLDNANRIAKINLEATDMKSEGTLTFAADGNAIAYSGVGIWGNVTSFRAENVAVAYR
jgi:hypothetical protein